MASRWKKLIRILDGKVRAILSDRYRIIDNYDLVFLALDEFQKKETIEIHRIDLTETMLYIKAIEFLDGLWRGLAIDIHFQRERLNYMRVAERLRLGLTS
jgi:hypothetical protein